ncbi:hypothetical protein [Actinokineospora fastidiosa]|uniref:Virulence factor Evf domain-containing protein n=1 Tax=Actinokineospora fastidiosa TaxID=1816 RepID=A0A918GU31_9PSEU|nr:hypothetical protein [Actinokineospora fastidiosa]GGS58551.1 hypothetical protein GCM10010171_61900 [Actinokineospora fastidiosa]
MCETLSVAGTTIAGWPGVEVYGSNGDGTFRRLHGWDWSTTAHWHYQVATFDTGSYWVPASTHPPRSWEPTTLITGDRPVDSRGVNPSGTEYRPSGLYLWIPAIPRGYTTGRTNNRVQCNAPQHPPNLLNTAAAPVPDAAMDSAHQRLDLILAEPEPLRAAADGTKFIDSDGLISFINLSTSLVKDNAEFKTGTAVFDKMANFFSTLRIKVFTALANGKIKPLQDDAPPTDQWSPAVTHYMQFLLQEAGGLTDYSLTRETYSDTQYLAEFSTAFIKTVFDAVMVPSSIISGVTGFISGVSDTLRHSWDDRTRTYSVALLGQCHEAVQENTDPDKPIYRYFPKLKYYYLSVSAHQTEFTTPCSKLQQITFDFNYEYYVTGVSAAVLDETSAEHQKFLAYLDKAQAVNYQDAQQKLDMILDGTVSASPVAPHGLGAFNVDLRAYPLVQANRSRRLTLA